MNDRLSSVTAEAPPASQTTDDTIFWREVVKMMRAAPAVAGDPKSGWHKIGFMSPGTITAIRQGKYPAFCPGEMDRPDRVDYVEEHWEFRAVSVKGEKNKRDIYARFLGE